MLYNRTNPHGGDIYERPVKHDFSANIHPLGTPDSVIRAMEKALTQVHHYPDPYCRELVLQTALMEKVSPEDVLFGNGAAELIYSFCDALKPQKSVIPAPSFSEYAEGLERNRGEIVYYPLKEEKDFDLDEEILPFLEQERPEALFLCDPNNPTGRLLDDSLFLKILELSEKLSFRVFLDECFLSLSEKRESAVRYLNDYPKLFILKAFTKSHALPGVRLGYGMTKDHELLKKLSALVQPWNVSLLAQEAGKAAVQETDWAEKGRSVIRPEREYLTEKLKEMGFRVIPSSVNFILFKGPEGLSETLKETGILIRNCENYEGLGQGWYRTAVRTHEENEELVKALWQKIS